MQKNLHGKPEKSEMKFKLMKKNPSFIIQLKAFKSRLTTTKKNYFLYKKPYEMFKITFFIFFWKQKTGKKISPCIYF